MLLRTLAAAMSCLVASTLGLAEDKTPDDAQRLQRTWLWDPNEKQSDAQPLVIVERVVIKGDKLTFHYRMGDQRSSCVTVFKLNPKPTPKQIDFTPIDGANRGKTYVGLYEYKDGRLKICYRGPGSTRPKDFTDKADGNNGTAFIFLVAPPPES